MNTIDTIREFKTRNFTVRVTAEEDYDMDLSFDETGEVRAKLEGGEYIGFCAAVRVYCHGAEVGTDYLGGCIYESPRAFMDHFGIRQQKGCGSYFSDMVRSAIAEARKFMADMCSVRIRKHPATDPTNLAPAVLAALSNISR